MKKRERLDIVFDLLCIIRDKNDNVKPTPLMRYANLSTKSFADYISFLEEKSFVKKKFDKNKRAFYSLEDKGFEFISRYQNIKGFIEDFDL